MVGDIVERSQRELEAALPQLGAVAGPHVATHPREQRLHLVGEGDWLGSSRDRSGGR